MADFLDEKRQEINARLTELRPLAEEYRRLGEAAAALAAIAAPLPSGPGATRQTRTNKPAHKNNVARAPLGRGRPKGSGKRSAEALKIVRENPGITIPEIAQRMGIRQNYLYRVLPTLATQGHVKQDGRGWLAVFDRPPAPSAPSTLATTEDPQPSV